MKIEISASERKVQGTGASRRLRRSGRVPGIVYGGEQGAVNIELDHNELYRNLVNEKFHASILTLKLAGGAEQVLLRAFNMHPFKAQVQHVDFQRRPGDGYVPVAMGRSGTFASEHPRTRTTPQGTKAWY